MLNVLIAIFFFVFIHLENHEFFFRFFYVLNPIGTILDILFPDKMPLGMIVRTISIFFNILIYIGLAIILGKLIAGKHQKDKSTSSA